MFYQAYTESHVADDVAAGSLTLQASVLVAKRKRKLRSDIGAAAYPYLKMANVWVGNANLAPGRTRH